MLHFPHVEVVKPQPFHIKSPPEAIERIAARRGLASKASHATIALESTALADREDQYHCWGGAIGIIERLLVLPLSSPHVVLD